MAVLNAAPLDLAKKKGFIVVRTGEAKTLLERYNTFCHRTGRPFITVRVRWKHAFVEMELPQGWTLNAAARAEIDAACRAIPNLSYQSFGAEERRAAACHIPEAEAPALAALFYSVALSYRPAEATDPGQTNDVPMPWESGFTGDKYNAALMDGLAELPGSECGLTVSQALKLLNDNPESFATLRGALMTWSRDGKLPSPKSIGGRLNRLRRRVISGKEILSTTTCKGTQVWQIVKVETGRSS